MKNIGTSAVAALYLLHWPGAYHSTPVRWTVSAFIFLNLMLWLVDNVMRPRQFSFLLPEFSARIDGETAAANERLVMAATLFLFVCGYLYLRTLGHNYFNQDDNFSQFGPVILQGATSLIEKGVFPNWNPFQFMGAPIAEVGTYALTYPITYLSVAVAKYALNEPEAWADVFFLIHAVPGLLLAFRVLRIATVTSALSMAGSLAFIFCGYNLIAGRSWFYMLPLMTSLPIMAWLLLTLEKFSSRRWLWTAALTTGVGFHSGNSQMWFYWVLFLGMGILFRLFTTPQLAAKAVIRRSLSAFLMGLGFAMPLLLPQLIFVAGVKRFPLGLEHIADNLPSLLIPFPFIVGSFPNGIETDDVRFGQIYYAGTLFTLVAIFLTASYYVGWLRKRTLKKDPIIGLFLFLGAAAFILSLGEFGILWRLLSYFPPFSLFSHPFKLIVFLHFFWIAAAARYLSSLHWRQAWVFPLISLLLTAYHLSQCTEAKYLFTEREYTSLPPQLIEKLKQNAGGSHYYRIDSNSPLRHKAEGYLFSLPHNFPTAYGIAATWGYDPLVNYSAANRPLYELWTRARCGDADAQSPPFKIHKLYLCPPGKTFSSEPLENLLRVTGVSSRITFPLNGGEPRVRAIKEFDPIVFSQSDRSKRFAFSLDFSGLTVENSRATQTEPIVVNFLWRKPFTVAADGQKLPIEKDEWGRMVVKPIAPWKTLKFSYRPPWVPAVALGILFFLSGLLTLRFSVAVSKTLESSP